MAEIIDIDVTLLKQMRDGDEKAFKKLFDKYYTPLTIYADKMLNDEDTASDIVQSLFMSIYENRTDIEVKKVRSFLFQSVHNRCLNEIKHQKIKSNYEGQTLEMADEASMGVDEIVEVAELEARLANAIKELPTQCRIIFEKSRFDGKTNAEIADELSLSKRTVETQISKALKILREVLGHLYIAIAILMGII